MQEISINFYDMERLTTSTRKASVLQIENFLHRQKAVLYVHVYNIYIMFVG